MALPLHASALRPFAPHVVACNAMIQDTHTHTTYGCYGNLFCSNVGESSGPCNVGESSGPSKVGESSGPSNVGESSGPSNVSGIKWPFKCLGNQMALQMLGNQVALRILGNQVTLQMLGNQLALQMLGIRGFFFGRDGSRGPSGLAAFGVVLL